MPEFLENLPKLPTPGQMGQWDKAAIEFGLPDSLLMENAGSAIFRFLAAKFPGLKNMEIAIFMGKGNNGGDGACIARHLADHGAKVVVFHMAPLDALHGASAWEVDLAKADGVIFEQISPLGQGAPDARIFLASLRRHGIPKPDIIVDALLGTGFANELRPDFQAVIEAINRMAMLCGSFILAVDIPSGLNGLTGQPAPVAVRADATVTLAAAKTGLLQPPAREWTGPVYARGIGFPRAIAAKCPFDTRLLDGRALLMPQAVIADSYKNTYGHVLVFGGAKGLSGAAHIAAAAALRAGAGLVTACAPPESCAQIKNGWPEIMTHALGMGGEWPEKLDAPFLGLAARASAIVIGPGMGRGKDSAAFLRALLAMENRPPAVIDADALAILGANAEWLELLSDKDILTPHPGEAGMLLDCPAPHIQADRPGALVRLRELSKAAVVLKGAYTMLAQARQPNLLCPYDIPQMAIGGAGDALSGIAGAFLARGQENALACAALAVITHVIAGMILAEKYPGRGAKASELADAAAHAPQWLVQKPKSELLDGIVPWPQFC